MDYAKSMNKRRANVNKNISDNIKNSGKSLDVSGDEGLAGRPTGQGYGAARKGPNVLGPETNVVVDEDYSQPEPFKTEK